MIFPAVGVVEESYLSLVAQEVEQPTAPSEVVSSVTSPPAPPPPNPECDMKNLNTMFGMTASDIDKYSRIVFPVTFTCFQLMYWIIYQFLSDDFDTEDNFIFLGEVIP